jgi:cation-transporting ATPase 13A3/4/5
MSVGIIIAINQLKNASIFCISPSRVNIAGKINIMCFDKTGTLTEEGLDTFGVIVQDQNYNHNINNHTDSNLFFNRLISNETIPSLKKEKGMSKLIFDIMASCHSIMKV